VRNYALEPLYSPSDKDLADLLLASANRPAADGLRKLLSRRGVMFSRNAERAAVIQEVVRHVHSVGQLTELLNLLRTEERTPKVETTQVKCEATVEELHGICEVVRDARKQRGLHEVMLITKGMQSVSLNIDYMVPDWSASSLRQFTLYRAWLQYESGNSGFRLRTAPSQRSDEIAKEVQQKLKAFLEASGKKLSLESVRLTGRSAEQRTEFFLSLMKALDGYAKGEATHVGISRLDADDQADEDVAAEARRLVNKILLSGGAVGGSQELLDFLESKKGWFISEAKWYVSSVSDSTRYLLEAKFRAAQEGRRFHVRVAGVYPVREDGISHWKSPRAPTPAERRVLEDLLHEAAVELSTP
jgi:hypothetical protein